MALKQAIAVVLGLTGLQTQGEPGRPPLNATAVLQEPDYFVQKEGERWTVAKPRLRALKLEDSASPRAWVIFEHVSRAAVEERRKALPRLRLSRALVQFNPLTKRRMLLEDWTRQEDAKEVEADVQAIVNRFAPATTQALFSSTPLYLARLNGASGHTAEEWSDPRRYVVYVDPFRATGRLHAASTLVHELSHVERYESRGFHANRAATVLPREDFVLLGSADEFAAYEAEAALVEAYLGDISGQDARQAVRKAMLSANLRWPLALTILLGVEAPSDRAARLQEAREQIVFDLQRQATRYWDLHHRDRLDPKLEGAIRNWYSESREWREIVRQREDWVRAGADVRRRVSAGSARLRDRGRNLCGD